MFTRTVGWLVTPIWLLAMSWLVAHDIAPHWTASPPPALTSGGWLADGTKFQFTLHDRSGPMGTVWSEYAMDERSLRRDDLIWIERLPVDIAPLRIVVESVFTAEGILDEFSVRLETRVLGQSAIRLHGERFHSDFSFTLDGLAPEKSFKIPLVEGGFFSGAFHPFGALTNLHVGQRWRMQVVNPISLVTGIGNQFIPLLVEVTGEQRLSTADGDVNCFVVESSNAKAWVDAGGSVRAQEMTLPMLGTMRLEREPRFDDKAYNAARNDSSALRGERRR